MTVEEALPSFPPPLADPTQPAPLFARLRERCPVARVELPSGDRAWLVTGYEDNRRLFTDPRFSRAAATAAGAPQARPVPLEHRSITTIDPPEHTRIRRAALPWFTPAAARRQRPSIERTAGALLDRAVCAGPPADLVVGYAQPLALAVMGDLLGIPVRDRDRFRAWTDDYLGVTGASAAVVARASAGLTSYLTALMGSPAEGLSEGLFGGLLGGLSGAADRAGGLSGAEAVALAVTVAVAGYQTVANEIAASVVALLRDPEQWRLLRERRVRLATAVEELLRYTPIAASGGTIRVATGEVVLGGVRVRAGEAVLPSTTSANRDGTVYRDPDRLDLSRNPNPHLAFGHGVHRCLGAHLARVELRVAIGVLLARLPRLRLAVPLAELPWQTDRMIRGPRTLPVVWESTTRP